MHIATAELYKNYGLVNALSDVNLEIAGGLAVALLGANGAGKSTLLRCLAGIALPTSGTTPRVCDIEETHILRSSRNRIYEESVGITISPY